MTQVRRDEHGDVDRSKTWEWEDRRLRRRATYALELMAVALYEDDPLGENMQGIRKSPVYARLVARLKGETGVGAGEHTP